MFGDPYLIGLLSNYGLRNRRSSGGGGRLTGKN